jgi:hypothetical protein
MATKVVGEHLRYLEGTGLVDHPVPNQNPTHVVTCGFVSHRERSLNKFQRVQWIVEHVE